MSEENQTELTDEKIAEVLHAGGPFISVKWDENGLSVIKEWPLAEAVKFVEDLQESIQGARKAFKLDEVNY